ncbi:uncharacterized protein LOC128988496 [Macrosteles quadrilineatus]|uniref:uncharacterized protein LOC128982407 n=2 Tax=Macrosteles quadrilineatus TaxID=74068 RepID=UPI0023E2B47B|nr:uncharacterized protein LOC128982407 [Macrosteles quadrilineatus]XP_054257538.1 uncharacterized protein LOC128982604 [Macrosteles quadrilineatus]XP_054259569.1 uncharacterized protein LOC128984289 [Macrosteles quadrilineatus]XP_054259990.1 uncharacterized protein LOC128984679 [Macrosteles quadrilineatus]XP_054260365.1 uncharacterized protein LOC128985017 [Macrosteles quadrilineatus]XP_054260383.1 uncharacterized protein LOC128985033 [Macrosteles quadrilineatus]XP_054265807.1 uncharacterize
MAMLAIENAAMYDDSVTSMEYHNHQPYVSCSYRNNDEVRIPILQQDILTLPFDSYVVIHGKVEATKTTGATALDVNLVNNGIAFLFDEVRYEICGKEIDRTRNVGITTTLKNLVSIREEEKNVLQNACWFGPGETVNVKDFIYSIPLRLLLGFAEDYRKVIVNSKQELILLRSSTDLNAVSTSEAGTLKLEIVKIYWRVPHVMVNDSAKLRLYKYIEKDPHIHIPFRQWEMHEYANLPTTSDSFSWPIRTTNQLEKPRYIIVGFQTGRKNDITKDMSQFDSCDVKDIKVYLNSIYYPYDALLSNTALFYDAYANFQSSYYGRVGSPILNFTDYTTKCPIYIIDCSKQNDSMKTGPVEVKLDIQTNKKFPANTWGYCLIIHDCHYTYTPLTGDVRKISV